MTFDNKNPILALAVPGGKIEPRFMEACRNQDFRVILQPDPGDQIQDLKELAGAGQVKVPAKAVMAKDFSGLVQDFGIRTVWVDCHPLWVDDPKRVKEALAALAARVEVIPILTSPESISDFVHPGSPFRSVALKGREGWGLVGSESLSLLFSLFRKKAGPGPRAPRPIVWGGLVRPEAVAAFLACGAAGVVFERLALALDYSGDDPEERERRAKRRPEQAEVWGTELGLPFKVFHKGLSPEISRLRREIKALDPSGPDLKAKLRKLAGLDPGPGKGGEPSSPALALTGPEEALAGSFVQRFGTDPAAALAGFRDEIYRSWEKARTAWGAFLDSPLSLDFGLEYPFVQGAMAWITDNPEFALEVSQAGGLPTVSLGLRDRAALDRDFSGLEERLKGRAFAVNLLVLPENTGLEDQLAWIKEARPDLTVMVAFNKAVVRSLKEASLKVACLATDKDNMALALRSGADYLILEGHEAGGHVGSLSTLTLAQIALDLREEQPELFSTAGVILAGGIFDRETVFRAAMLGAWGVQMGTVYLATREITSTGCLSPCYQEMILQAGPGETVVTGGSLGLSVRALDTPKIRELINLEKEIQRAGLAEAEARFKVESMVAGSLYVAAKSSKNPGGDELDRETCLAQGQFIAGAGSGLVDKVQTLSELHHSLTRGPFQIVPAPAGKRPKRARARTGSASPERIAITGMAVFNALGNSVERILEATLGMESGITQVSSNRWDHDGLYDPKPRTVNKTYCRWGAFHNLEVSRKALGIPPHDFRTMSHSTRQTLWLADQALKDSGLLDSGLAPEKIGVIVSQNAGEASTRLQELTLNFLAPKVVRAVQEIVNLDSTQAEALEKRLRSMGLETDDTTLLGRLNSAAGGFICNKYGFRGPCFAVTAACATSLVALYNACTLIRNGTIDAAVVGGSEENLSEAHYLEFSALGALAGISGVEREPRAASRPFDLGRDGMVMGEGGGMIVIERESAARARGSDIKAFVTSMGASNNDRGMVESLAETQIPALKAALNGLGCDPQEIGLVECHATSTSLGDVEEVKALKSVFPQGDGPVLAAFKSQIGHTLGASGLNGLIRAVVCMREGVLPGTLNYDQPDPDMDLEGWGFRVLPKPEPWPSQDGRPRRAMVNAFGFGGANYVVTLEENQEGPDRSRTVLPRKTSGEIGTSDAVLSGLSFFRVGSGGREVRAAVISARNSQAEQALAKAGQILFDPDPKAGRKLAAQGIFSSAWADKPQSLALVMAGQGTYYPGMGQEIYQACGPIQKTMDRIAGLAGYDLLGLLFNQEEDGLRQTRWQQPALFTLEYALAQYLLDLGIRPTALAGHSLGELVALCLAKVYSLEHGFGIVDKRAQCMAKAADLAGDPGAMLAVDPRQEGLKQLVEAAEGIFYTNYNSPAQAVLGGPTQVVMDLQKRLADKGFRATRLKVSMAFHSPIMKIIREDMARYVSGIELRPPRVPVLSNTTGRPYPEDPDQIRPIIMAHLEAPVLWQQNVEALWNDFQVRDFVEIGPRDTLSSFIADTLPQAACFQTCRPQEEVATLRFTLAKLFCQGRLVPPGPVTVLDLDRRDRQAPSTKTAPPGKDGLNSLVQAGINRFILDRFGDMVKPAIVEDIRRSHDPRFSAQDLEDLLQGKGRSLPRAEPPAPARARPTQAIAASLKDQSPDFFLEEVIRIIMEATGYDRDEIEPDMDLRQSLAIRSSRFPVIIDSAEQTFGITIEWTDFIDVRTVRELADRVALVAQRDGAAPRDEISVPPAPQAEKKPKPLPEMEVSPEDRGDPEPILRVVEGEVPLDTNGSKPLDLDRGGTVVLLAPTGQDTAVRIAAHLSRKRGLRVLNLDLEDPANDLADPQGAARVAGIIQETKGVTGLVLVLDDQALDRLDPAAPAFLRGCFVTLKSFLEKPEKAFCLAVAAGPGQPDRPRVVSQGLAGMFMTGALEYGSVLFGALALDQATDPGRALETVLTQPRKPVRTIFRDNQPHTPETRVSPSTPHPNGGLTLEPGEVVVISGGGRGVTSHLAAALAPYGPRLVLLGRSAPNHPEHGPRIKQTLSALKEAGLEAEYIPCDVTDPARVEEVMSRVEQTRGPIRGLIHGAGMISDAFALFMSEEAFGQVVETKVAGAKNLLAATEERGLGFVVGLSSAAVLQGSPGQINYTCANMALAALIREIDQSRPKIKGRVLLLPPIAGDGMAHDPEVRQLMELKGLAKAYVDLEELKALFRRELFGTDSPNQALGWLRDLPRTKTALLDLDPPEPLPEFLDCAEMRVPTAQAPMIGRVNRVNLKRAFLEAERTLSASKDLWLPDHRPLKLLKHPIVSGVMAVETMAEAAGLLYPDLSLKALREVEFKEILECPPDTERTMRIEARGRSRGAQGELVEILIFSRDLSPSGRVLESESLNYRCRVLLAWPRSRQEEIPDAPAVNPGDLDTGPLTPEQMARLYQERTGLGPRYRIITEVEGSGPGLVRGSMVYPGHPDFQGMENAVYAYPVYVLEGLTQLIHLHPFLRRTEIKEFMLPAGLEEMWFARFCDPGEKITLTARVEQENRGTLLWNAWACDAQGRELMSVHKYVSRKMVHPVSDR